MKDKEKSYTQSEVDISFITERLEDIEEMINETNVKLDRIIYGAIGLFLTGVMGVIIALTI